MHHPPYLSEGHCNGHCALDIYISMQTQLDSLYRTQHNGAERCNDNDAVLFPDIANNSVMWNVHASTALLTRMIRTTITRANRQRVGKKDPELYTTHSLKVGGAVECGLRNMSIHEGQAFTSHVSLRNFLMYAMLLGVSYLYPLIHLFAHPHAPIHLDSSTHPPNSTHFHPRPPIHPFPLIHPPTHPKLLTQTTHPNNPPIPKCRQDRWHRSHD
jgi:hypothetical protein